MSQLSSEEESLRTEDEKGRIKSNVEEEEVEAEEDSFPVEDFHFEISGERTEGENAEDEEKNSKASSRTSQQSGEPDVISSSSSSSFPLSTSSTPSASEDRSASSLGSLEEKNNVALEEKKEKEEEEHPVKESDEAIATPQEEEQVIPVTSAVFSEICTATPATMTTSPPTPSTFIPSRPDTHSVPHEQVIDDKISQKSRSTEEEVPPVEEPEPNEEEKGRRETNEEQSSPSLKDQRVNRDFPHPPPSTFQQIASAVSEFQAILHESFISTTLESSAVALTQTLQQLLQIHEEEKDAFHKQEQQQYEAKLSNYREAIHSMTIQMRCEREGKGRGLSILGGASSTHVENEEEQSPEASSMYSEKENLVADFAQATGHIKLLEQDVRHVREVNQQLRSVLGKVVHENNALREELTSLQVSTIPRKDYEEEVHQHQKTKHELDLLKIEVETMEGMYKEVMEHHEALVKEQLMVQECKEQQEQLIYEEEEGAQFGQGNKEPALSTEEPSMSMKSQHQHQAFTSSATKLSTSPVLLWSSAVQQMEEHANHVVEQNHLRMECHLLKAKLDDEKAAKEEEAVLRREREKEVQRLSLDGQDLLFRNQVLSQQVVSLLEKVEQLERRHRALALRSENKEAVMQNTGNEASMEEVKMLSSMNSSSGYPCGSGAAAAAVAFHILQNRTESYAHSSHSFHQGQSEQYEKKSSIVEEEENEKRGRMSRPLRVAQLGGSISSLMYTAPLETPLEIRSTLSQQLSSFSPECPSTLRRNRMYTLRSLGLSVNGPLGKEASSPRDGEEMTPSGEEGLSFFPHGSSTRSSSSRTGGTTLFANSTLSKPSLPNCDLLSGSALQRLPSYAVLNPAQGTAEIMGNGNLITAPLALLDVMGEVGKEEVEGGSSLSPAFHAEEGINQYGTENKGETSVDALNGKENVKKVNQWSSTEFASPSTLGHFAANSVEELVKRNQELVSQLYRTTQILKETEHRIQQQLGSLSHGKEPGKTESEGFLSPFSAQHLYAEASHLCSSSEKNSSPAILRSSGGSSISTPHALLCPLPPPLAARLSNRESSEPRASSSSCNKGLENKNEGGERTVVQHSSNVLQVGSEEILASAMEDPSGNKVELREQRILNVLLQDHFQQLHEEQDHLLTSQLLDVLSEVQRQQPKDVMRQATLAPPQRKTTTARTSQEGEIDVEEEVCKGKGEGNVGYRQYEPIMAAMVDLCCSQAVQIAHTALSEASSSTDTASPGGSNDSTLSTTNAQKKHQQMLSNESDLTKAHDLVLKRLLDGLRTTLLEAVSAVKEDKKPSRSSLGSPSTLVGANTVSSSPSLILDSAHVDLLQRVMRLFEVANRKEDLLYQILRHGQMRKEKLASLQVDPISACGRKRRRIARAMYPTAQTGPQRDSHRRRQKRWRKEEERDQPASSFSPSCGSTHPPSPAGHSKAPSPLAPASSPPVNTAPTLLLYSNRLPSSPLSPMPPLPPSTATQHGGVSSAAQGDARSENATTVDLHSLKPQNECLSPHPPSPLTDGDSPEAFLLPIRADRARAKDGDVDDDDEWEEEDYSSEEEEDPIWKQLHLPPPSSPSSSSAYQETLLERLAFQQALRQKLVTELEEEKAKHLKLLENMWKLEWERDEAVAETKKMKEHLVTTVPIEVHQQVLTRMDEMEKNIQESHSKLAEKEALLQEVKNQLDASSQKNRDAASSHEESMNALKAQLSGKQIALEAMEEKIEKLKKEERILEDQCVNWQEQSAKQNAIADSLEKQVRGMENKIHRLEIEFLSRKNVQELLTEMFPVDGHEKEGENAFLGFSSEEDLPSKVATPSFITHHRINLRLIKDMREERDKLCKQITHNQLYIQRLEDKLAQLNQDLQEAQQQNQQTQLELLQRMQSFSNAEGNQTFVRIMPSVLKEGGQEKDVFQGLPSSTMSGGIPLSSSLSAFGSSASSSSANSIAIPPTPPDYYLQRQRELEEEVSYLHHEMKILEDRECGFVKREQQLREELDMMSKDPVSENVRRFGLAACQSLSEQCAVIHERNTVLQEQLKGMTEAVAQKEKEKENGRKHLRQVEEERNALQNQLETVKGQLSTLKHTVDGLNTSFRDAVDSADAKDGEITFLTAEIKKLQEKDENTKILVQKLRTDNVELMKQLESFHQVLQEAVEREKDGHRRLQEAEAALKQAKVDMANAIDEARASSASAHRSEVVSTLGERTGGSSAQSRLRLFPVSVTRGLQENSHPPFA